MTRCDQRQFSSRRGTCSVIPLGDVWRRSLCFLRAYVPLRTPTEGRSRSNNIGATLHAIRKPRRIRANSICEVQSLGNANIFLLICSRRKCAKARELPKRLPALSTCSRCDRPSAAPTAILELATLLWRNECKGSMGYRLFSIETSRVPFSEDLAGKEHSLNTRQGFSFASTESVRRVSNVADARTMGNILRKNRQSGSRDLWPLISERSAGIWRRDQRST